MLFILGNSLRASIWLDLLKQLCKGKISLCPRGIQVYNKVFEK